MTTDTAAASNGIITRAPALVRDQVANYLRDQITNKHLPPGAPLVERAICTETTASRATVREALRQLESDGLVVSELGKGTFVASLTRKEAEDIYAVRARLEGFACRLFTVNADESFLTRLGESVAEIRSTIDDPQTMVTAKRGFYALIFEGSGNREISRLVEALRRRIALLRTNSLSVPGRPEESLNEIEQIYQAIVDRDPDRAEDLCVKHISAAARTIMGAPGAHFAD